MKSEWQRLPVQDVCSLVTSGGTPSRTQPEFYIGGSWSWIKTQELKDTWIDKTEEHITSEAIVKSAAKILPEKTILMAMYGATVGQLGILRSPMTCNQACCAMVVDEDKADPFFLFYQLLLRRKQFQNLATGAAQQNLNTQTIKKFVLDFPPIPEQKAIARILGSLDDKIELNRRMNATLEQMAQTLFRAWFVDFEPVKAKAAGLQPVGMDAETAALFPSEWESSTRLIPKGWEVGNLSDVCEARRETVQPSSVNSDSEYVGLEHIPQNSIALNNWGRAEQVDSTKSRFQQGDILFGKLRPYFHKVVVAPVNGICSTDILVLQAINRRDFGFVLCHVSSPELIDYATRLSNGARMPRVGWKDIAAYSVVIPPPAIQETFTRTLIGMISKINVNVFESQTLAQLRDALLPRLVSGALRVPEAMLTENL